ncbi:hypothetical protein [Phenylobacterium sp.]|jgi:hypothetical protein|uniref:hypothetical protein n=1 Tax=Phenylobacterium sp. TaxID=1871053 RepID=UPI002E359FED|nr:hypothetical protein [Phenylobacterium sp.]HEX4709706.1 hypothetical protein [Phenylobacterium sp.]
MSHSAFSQHYDRELDVRQLLRLRGVTATLDDAAFELTASERDWMRADLLCPSCRCAGASVVLSDVVKPRGRNTRQAHFRFLDGAGRTAHTLGCDFYPLDDEPGFVRGVDVQFSANDKDTRVVRELVCKAVGAGELTRADIYAMRSWFLAQRDASTFDVRGSSGMVDWLWGLRGLPTYEAVEFKPFHVTLPGFDTRNALRRHMAFLYKDFLAGQPRVPFDAPVRDRAKRLLTAHQGGQLIMMGPLREKFDAAVTLASLMVQYGELKLSQRRIDYFGKNAPPALLALSATLLFVSDWHLDAAFERFATISATALPADLTAGNVMGLNPFHDFAALEIARFVASLSPEPGRAYDLQAEFEAVREMIMSTMRGPPPTPP